MIHTTQECRIGAACDLLRELPGESIDTVITSPPYWSLRDYQVAGQIGMEPTLEEYHDRLLEVTAEIMRVMKSTAVLFWNHGDNYGGSGGSGGDYNAGGLREGQPKVGKSINTTAKCLTMQNARLIMRMIDEQGFILRNRIIWNKPNGMPSSVQDRFSNKYEPIYMLVKATTSSYYCNHKTGAIQRDKPLGTKGEEGVDWDWKEIGADYSESDTKIQSEDAEMSGSPRARVHRERVVKKTSHWRGHDYWFDLDAVRVPHKDATEVKYRMNLRKNKNYNVKAPYDSNTPYRHNAARTTSQESPNRMWGDDATLERLLAAGKNPGDVWDIPSPEDDWKQLLEVMAETVGVVAAVAIFESYTKARNVPGNVWTIPTQPFSGSHFAVFPPPLIEPMIKAACPAEICPVCGLARVRITERVDGVYDGPSHQFGGKSHGGMKTNVAAAQSPYHAAKTTGWTDCGCGGGWVAGTVLDPFCGSGTVLEVCRLLNRNAIGFDLNPAYEPMIVERSRAHTPPLTAYFDVEPGGGATCE